MDETNEPLTNEPELASYPPYLVMLVDDQPMVAEALRRILTVESDMDFHYCGEPGSALKIAGEIKPSVILLDLVMPDIDGLTVLRALREHAATRIVPVVVLSSQEDAAMKAEAFAVGANDYLIKWPDRIELLARLRYHSQWYSNMQQRDEAFRALRVSQRKLAESNLKLQRQAAVDGLTGIPNRRYFDERFEEEWKRGAREQEWLSLIILDVDHFKLYNDRYGHMAGDECLKAVAQVIAGSLLRPTDLAARYGGEEFVLILPNTDQAGAEVVAGNMRKAVEALGIPHARSATGAVVTVSLGVATTVPTEHDQAQGLLAEADTALYAAKEAGRNRYAIAPLMRA
jgi:two-component system chemotaxis family response regulator WspR